MSGASESRPGLTALMADARRGAFDQSPSWLGNLRRHRRSQRAKHHEPELQWCGDTSGMGHYFGKMRRQRWDCDEAYSYFRCSLATASLLEIGLDVAIGG